MSSPGHRTRRRRGTAPRPLLQRILDTPHLAHVVPRLPPEVLHRIIQRCGLEDCGELVTLATPDQLARVFDLDLWRPAQPGLDERFDADRFGVWLEVLMESGDTVAAQTLAEIDVDLVITALAQHVSVFDPAAASPSVSTDGEELPGDPVLNDGLACDVGGYQVRARRADSWDAIVGVLTALDAAHRDYFHRVMRGCRTLSNSLPEIDGLDDLLTGREQGMFDLAFDREQRREEQGYVTPAQARAFLQMSRQIRLGHDPTPPDNPIARAYFRAIEETPPAEANLGARRLPAASGAPPDPEDSAQAVAAVVDVLMDEGVLTRPPRALLDGPQGQATRFARIQAQLLFVRDREPAVYALRSQELAYLANTIIAGCSIQGRPFTPQEASDAAAAVCNLGLENWPLTALHEDFLVVRDLVSVFQVGWTVLYTDVCMYAAERLIGVLTPLRCDDREIQAGLNKLRVEMKKYWRAGEPWRARDSLEVIVILDTPRGPRSLGLIDECPVMHAAIGATRDSRMRTVSASAFEFISENSQIATVREFMQSLPESLRL